MLMVAEAGGATVHVSCEAPTAVEPSFAESDRVSPSESEKAAGSMERVPLGLGVGESDTMTGSDPPSEHEELRITRKAEMPRGKRRRRPKEREDPLVVVLASVLVLELAFVLSISATPVLFCESPRA